jgi:transcriptional regulator with XRE-family HTH domain
MSESLEPLIQEHLPKVKKNKKSCVPPYAEIGERLKLVRGNRSATEIEALSGVSDTAIGKCEKGQQSPSLELLAYYSLEENIPIDLIMFGFNPPGGSLLSLRIQCLALPLDQRVALAREILADLGQTDAP